MRVSARTALSLMRACVTRLIVGVLGFSSAAWAEDAAQPPAGETVSWPSTSTAGLTLAGEMSRPPGAGPFPAVVMLHGCGGVVRKHDPHWAERFRAWGYVAVQVDSFRPRGISSVCSASSDEISAAAKMRVADAYDAKRYLGSLSFVDRARIYLVGWSHGGWAALQALHRRDEPPFRAAVAFYPYCGDRDSLSALNAPLLVLIGNADTLTPSVFCSSALPSGRSSPEVVLTVFPSVYHAFDALDLDEYVTATFGNRYLLRSDPAAAAEAITEVKSFFEKYSR